MPVRRISSRFLLRRIVGSFNRCRKKIGKHNRIKRLGCGRLRFFRAQNGPSPDSLRVTQPQWNIPIEPGEYRQSRPLKASPAISPLPDVYAPKEIMQ